MARDVLDLAEKFMKRRQFDKALKFLDGRAEIYEGNFEYYLLYAIACLYVGDTGAASSYFQKARNIRLTDTNLLLGQAALFLRRGDTDRALQYYLEMILRIKLPLMRWNLSAQRVITLQSVNGLIPVILNSFIRPLE